MIEVKSGADSITVNRPLTLIGERLGP